MMRASQSFDRAAPSREGTSTSPMALVLSKLSGRRQKNRYVKALCPAHNAREQSLSIRELNDGTVRIKCFANCTKQQVLSALHLSLRDLHPRRGQDGRYEWHVKDAAGRAIAIHHRRDGGKSKTMWWSLPDGTRGLGGIPISELPLYRSEHSGSWSESPVVIVEGERATDALARVYPAVLGTVTGAGSAPSKEALHVLEGRDAVLWPDADEPGRAHMKRIARELRGMPRETRVYEWPAAPPGGDAADRPAVRGKTAERLFVLLNDVCSAPISTDQYQQEVNANMGMGEGVRGDKKGSAERLVLYAHERLETLFLDQYSEPHVLMGSRAIPLNSRCYSWLRMLMWEQEERAASGESLKAAAGTLAAQAEYSG